MKKTKSILILFQFDFSAVFFYKRRLLPQSLRCLYFLQQKCKNLSRWSIRQ